MVKSRYVLFLAACFTLTTCSIGMDGPLGRITGDPFSEIPNVKSFNGDFSIIINWSKDEAADKYLLYRAADDPNPHYQLIYEGTQTEYRDIFALPQEDKLYIYRLGKQRGSKLFYDEITRGKAGLGVVSGSNFDVLEDNNSIDKATLLNTTVLEANCWFYLSNTTDDVSIYDEDWYYVNVPAQWVAEILVKDHDVVTGTELTHFKLEKWNIGSETIHSDTSFEIINYTDNARSLFFRIYPDVSIFKGEHIPPSGGGGKFIRYSIKVSSLRPR